MGVLICSSRFSSVSTVLITSNPCRAQDGHEMMFTPRCRRPSDFRISKPIFTSSTGSAESDTRIVSPSPAQSRLPSPMADFTVPPTKPAGLGDAEVDGRIGLFGQHLVGGAVMKTSEAFTLILKFRKSLSCRIRM
jgi:hypothetical protein